MEQETKTEKPKIIEREFYVLTVDKNNQKNRRHSKETVQKWIDDLNNKNPEHYKIEYAIDVLEKDVKNHFINDALYCGIVTKLELKGDELFATSKFKTKGVPNEEMLTNPDFFNNLTLVPKGVGQIKDCIICDYELYGFNLVKETKSAFFATKDIKLETPEL